MMRIGYCVRVIYLTCLICIIVTVDASYKCRKKVRLEMDQDELIIVEDTSSESEVTSYREGLGKDLAANYSLTVTNSGPCVVYSFISFLAKMTPFAAMPSTKSLFMYVWHNDANQDVRAMYSNWTSNITSYTFDKEEIIPNKYLMTVCVYKRTSNSKGEEILKLVANGSTKFEITNTLNGKEHLEQKTNDSRTENYYATAEKTTYSVRLLDEFQDFKPEVVYSWSVCNKLFWESTVNNFTFQYMEPGPCHVECVVKASLPDQLRRKISVSRKEQILEELQLEGVWRKDVIFQDEVRLVNISLGETIVNTGKMFKANISYTGSNTTFCWDIIPEDNSTIATNQTCEKSPQKWHILTLIIPLQGVYRLHVHISNNVSSVTQLSQPIFISDPVVPLPQSSSTSQTLPIVISIIGITVIVLFAAHLVRVNIKSRNVEVANFDFHPTLHEVDQLSWRERLISVWNSTREFFASRNTYDSEHSYARFRPSTARHYGTLDDTNVVL
ncbi:hypothetical protein FSP39_008111 [Pinctada imbricata]|uniref:Uncharacterized protein n=1 Tax=Pinctada imbricata TaxID=66713 RepID=A0AA88XQP3_PINIB|nr:hypothetical protein FSP39_008111 [Pinctada imbricata]